MCSDNDLERKQFIAVDGVNNSNNNTALYTAGAALVGGGAGAAVGWYSRPFLKDGAPTDSFVKKIQDNVTKHIENLTQEIDNLKNVDELKNYIKNNEALKEAGMVESTLAAVDEFGFEAMKASLKQGVSIGSGGVTDSDVVKGMFEASWDKNAKKFVHNADELSKEGFEAVKKAAKSIQGKYAMIYGAIGAGVLGLATLLCCSSKKQPEQPQNIDQQA